MEKLILVIFTLPALAVGIGFAVATKGNPQVDMNAIIPPQQAEAPMETLTEEKQF